jgi:hypothetical protein
VSASDVASAVEPIAGPEHQGTAGVRASGEDSKGTTTASAAPVDAVVADDDAAFVSAVLSSDRCKNFSEAAFRELVRAEERRYLFMEPMRVGYGLTNQLMAYAALVFYAMKDNRTVVFPPARTPFSQIVSLEQSTLFPMFSHSRDICEDAAAGRLPGIRMKHKRFYFMRKAMNRGMFILNPTGALRKLYGFMRNVKRVPSVKVWDMYGRWPYGAAYLSDWETLPWFLCGLHFNDAVEQQTGVVYQLLAASALAFHKNAKTKFKYAGNTTHARYVAVHLRMEPQDMHSMGRSWSNATQVADFFVKHVLPLAESHKTRSVLLCSGRLHPDVEGTIHEVGAEQGFQILRKSAFNATFPEEKALSLDSHGIVIRPTNSFHALMDALLMERATAVVATAFSSLTASVYSRRCCGNFSRMGAARSPNATGGWPFSAFGGGPQAGSLYVYEVYMDGSLTGVREFPCGLQIDEYIVGRTIPKAPKELRIIASSFNKAHPLYSEPWRNDGGFQIPAPNSTEFVVSAPPRKFVRIRKSIRKTVPK